MKKRRRHMQMGMVCSHCLILFTFWDIQASYSLRKFSLHIVGTLIHMVMMRKRNLNLNNRRVKLRIRRCKITKE